jgi:hypothetical protein
MKLLLITGSDDTSDLVSFYVKPLGFDLIRYRHAIKAMDNLDEIDPSGIIINAEDFPRHWKVLLQFVRAQRSKDICPVILLTGNKFPQEEAAKALHLEVNGMVQEDLKNPVEVDRLQSILSRYVPVEEKRREHRIPVQPENRLGLIISNPFHKALITGDIKSISPSGLSFRPKQQTLMENIEADQELPGCSLRAGDAILSPVCRVVRPGRIVTLSFVSFPGDERQILIKYLEKLPLQELQTRQRS